MMFSLFSLVFALSIALQIHIANAKLCFVAIVKNEQQHVRAWIEYHRQPKIGGELFMIYDDESTDGTVDELAKTPGVILRSMKPHKPKKLGRQKAAYLEARDIFREEHNCTFVGFMDVDEYVANMDHTGPTFKQFLERQPPEVTSVAMSHGDFTVHHRSINDPMLYCPSMPKGGFLVEMDATICRSTTGTWKYFARPVKYMIPTVHTAVVQEPPNKQVNWNKLDKGMNFQLFHFKYPCLDLFLKKAVKGGRLAVRDWKYDLTNATAMVLGQQFLPMKDCLKSRHVDRARKALSLLRQDFSKVKPTLMTTRNDDQCSASSKAGCDPRYFWLCRCREDQCRTGVTGKQLEVPHVCSVHCCDRSKGEGEFHSKY